MAISYKVLGQSAPANTSNADLYTVPTATEAVVSTITISITTAVSATGKVYIRVNGAGAAAANALVFNTVFAGNSLTTLTLGLTLDAADVITVQSGTADALTFQAFGSEIS